MCPLWDSFGNAPTVTELDDLAQKGLLDGVDRHTMDCSEKWACPNCGIVFEPRKNLLVDLPEFECSVCKAHNTTAHSWKITDIIVNNICLEFEVYDQGKTAYCGIYSVVAAVDCARRVRGAMHHLYATANFHVDGMVEKYRNVTGFTCGSEPQSVLYDSVDNIPFVLTVVKNHGIPYSCGRYDACNSVGSLRIKDFFMVDQNDLNLIKRLIASGYPLLSAMRLGALFCFVDSLQVYLTPAPWEESSAHAIALIGTGLAKNTLMGKLETYFCARDSQGCQAHFEYEWERQGGDAFVWASDIIHIWGFHLEEEMS